MKQPLLFSLASLLTLSPLAQAQSTYTPVGGNWATSEPCLFGDANGICSIGDSKSEFLGKDSIVKAIGDDISREEGVVGLFERVSDDQDQLWKKIANAGNRGILIRVRSRYQGSPYAFGIIRGRTRDGHYSRVISDSQSATMGKILLNDCEEYEPRKTADGKARCAPFKLFQKQSALAEVAVDAGEVFQFAIERVRGLADDLSSIKALGKLASKVSDIIDKNDSKPTILRSSLPTANGGKDHMVTFKFNQRVKTVDGLETTIYLLAFQDGDVNETSDYNNYVVEVQLAEPAQ